jgi:sporulation protein YlmC with PRC-barrel domain
MTIVKPLALSVSLLAFAGASALAGEGSTRLDRNSDGSPSRVAAAGADESAGRQGAKTTGPLSADQLIGKKVSDAQGQEIGEIKDVVVDLQNGRVHAAVLEFGGTLGLGEKNYAFPISQLNPGKAQGRYTLNVDKQKLKDADGFAQGQWPAMNDEYWGKVGGQAKAGAGASQAQKMTLVRASELKGKSVSDKSGQEVGEVQDLMIDLKSGRLRSVVIGVSDGGQATVQPKALSSGMDDKLVLAIDAQQLKQQAKQQSRQRSGSGR